MSEHRLGVRVYLEDTDAQGIVYHANYLKYCERARTDILDLNGYKLAEMQELGWTFVVHEMHLKFHRTATLHDDLEVVSSAKRASAYRVSFDQKVFRRDEKEPVFRADVSVVAIGQDGNLRELPSGFLA